LGPRQPPGADGRGGPPRPRSRGNGRTRQPRRADDHGGEPGRRGAGARVRPRAGAVLPDGPPPPGRGGGVGRPPPRGHPRRRPVPPAPPLPRPRTRYAGGTPGEGASVADGLRRGRQRGPRRPRRRPFEYLVLRQGPRPWRPEDSLLAGYAMFIDLQLDS